VTVLWRRLPPPFDFLKSVPASNDSLGVAPSSENKLASPFALAPKSHHLLGGAQLVTASIKLSLLHHTHTTCDGGGGAGAGGVGGEDEDLLAEFGEFEADQLEWEDWRGHVAS
jgi:hypothetical protein